MIYSYVEKGRYAQRKYHVDNINMHRESNVVQAKEGGNEREILSCYHTYHNKIMLSI